MSVNFNWVKQCIVGQNILKQDTSHELTFRMHPKLGTHDSGEIEIKQMLYNIL